ncbi:hypothetical protein CDD81_4393 [Ophiocordyceps australis]|uniref:Lysyl-tRNA synthetase n=1 Tax=Ophiocordyceps australis TaxID=1399860 RepID=A0A2C5XMI0_9HYPO|nr:hypothetical protein CDD81_4393 [Ophiocordyceps australis]
MSKPEITSLFDHNKRQMAQDHEQQQEEPLVSEPYPRLESDDARESVPEFLQQYEEHLATENLVTLCGRVRNKRVFGKGLMFLDIANEFQRVQVMLNRHKCFSGKVLRTERFELYKNLVQIGDHISVTGVATRTSSGEPTLEASDLPRLLSPTMEQLPAKLVNETTRMHDRHVDMLVNREVLDVLRLKGEITKHMRRHFESKRFLEFQTPILAEDASGASARAFVTESVELRNKFLSLRIAPELWLKRLVVGGVDRVFEIGPAFRNEGLDATHNPEFTMCEFYSAYTNLTDLIKETEELICSLAKHCQECISTQLTSLPQVDLSRFARPFKQVEFVPALEKAIGVRLPKLTTETALAEVIATLKLGGIDVPGEVPSTLVRLLDRLATLYLEPMSMTEPMFLMNHPACMSPLAKSFLCPKTYQLVSARAEFYCGGRELANMYEEENNPREQKRKLKYHRLLVNKADGQPGFDPDERTKSRQRGGKGIEAQDQDPVVERDWAKKKLDESYVRALDHGLPPTGGWGCGLERLVMLFSGANRISDCLSFGSLRNVVGLAADAKAGGKARAAKTTEENDASTSQGESRG